MIVLIVSKAPPSLRGKLTRWLLQLKAGVYDLTCQSIKGGWAVLLYAANTEQGFAILSHGKSPVVFEDFEGLWLAKTKKKP